MSYERPFKFFRNGTNQAVRIPRDLEFPVEGGTMRREGTRLIIETRPKRTLEEVLDSLEPLPREYWMDPIDSLPVTDVKM